MANSTLSPEEQVPEAVPASDPFDQLDGGEVIPPAPPEPETDQGSDRNQPPTDRKSYLQKQLDRYKQGRQAAQKTTGVPIAPTKAEPGETVSQKVEERVQERARAITGKAIKEGAKKAAAWVARQAELAIAKVAAASPVTWIILGVLGLILVIILVVFTFFAFSRENGSGLPIYPNTVEEKFAATQLLAISGDPQAKAEVIIKEVADIKTKLEASLVTANKKLSGAKLAAFSTAVTETEALLDQLSAQAADSTHRNDTITAVNAKLKSLQDSYPEIFFSAGSCADLKEFIDNKKFIVQSGPNAALIVKGQMMNKAGQVWPASKDLCNSLVIALRAGYTITTGTLSYGHSKSTVSGNVSRHWCGAAIDISAVNGKAVNGSNTDAAAVSKLWYDAGHSGQAFIGELIVPTPYKQYEMKDGKDHTYGSKVQSGHETHIHLAGRIEDRRCK